MKNLRIGFHWWMQWTFSKCNWYDFTLINIAGEYSPYKASAELTIVLLGLGVTIEVYHKEKRQGMFKDTDKLIDDFMGHSDDNP